MSYSAAFPILKINMFSSGGSLGIPLQIFDSLMAIQFQNNFNAKAVSRVCGVQIPDFFEKSGI
ncbi:hypothetical protein WA1_05375 [Scytonema hofmannii PCC 7110]|uniref:Uncharacterized protein n=1 Tax=Scytonema hofmannii PCC 7110 TaxID=128403 RepID=A0A139WZU3_9CYAN|nr:hypothetical protein [Scytonema hofmannii]KYC37926.1 hypothetical protein WA1_05375 [Scytonema hofmannii PCC 7110]